MMILIPGVGLAQSRASGGDNFTLIVTAGGAVWSFGNNSNGQLGLGNTTDAKSPKQIPGLSGVVTVAAGGFHSLALTSTGDLYAWGDNVAGQVGDGSNTDRSAPQLVNLSNVVAIAAGMKHSLALTDAGNLYAWGENALGQLGTGNTSDSNIPVLILSGVSAIGAGLEHSLIVKSDGTAWAWGKNASGQLGNNVAISGATTTPQQMIGVSTAVAVYGGSAHSIIRLSDGTLKATGSNGSGRLGDGSTVTERLTPVAVVGLTGIQAVAVGLFHSLALDGTGAIWVWGDASTGAVGTGNQTAVNPPATLSSPTGISSIGAGWQHSIAIDTNGVVSTWGSNSNGELGDGTTTARWSPDAISTSSYAWRVATPTFSVAAGTYNTEKNVTVAVDTAGATIHYTVDGAEPTEAHATVSSGSSVTIDQSRTLKAKAWKTGMPASAIKSAAYTLQPLMPDITPSGGTFSSSQNVSIAPNTSGSTIRYTLDGTDPTSSSTAYAAPFAVDATTTIKSAAFIAGWSTSSVRTATLTFNYGPLDPPSITPATGTYAGSVSVEMSSAQSGATIRYTTNGSTPTASSTIYTSPIQITQTTTVKAKAFHSSYATSAETARTYTLSAASPTLSVAGGAYAPGAVVTISTNEATATLRMTIDGNDPTSTSTMVSSGTSLLLGNFTLKVKAFRSGVGDSAVASAAYTLTSALGPGAVTTGGAHNVLATPDGRVYVWGNNGNGQLGNESVTDRQTPTLINTITGVKAVASGLAHTLALTWDGQVYAWGSNGSGRLGDGSTNQSARPVHISTLSNVVAIAAGDTHSLALTGDGNVYSWGANTTGQLGLGNSGTGTEQIAPTHVTALSNIVAIAAGDADSFVVTSGGQVYAWGANGNSRLGDGSTSQQNSPLLLSLSNIVSIAAGQAHTLALTSAGRVYGWGANTNGQLGITPATTVATPTLISNFHVSAIAAGDNHSGAIRADGALVMWGNSPSGQVGTGSITATVSTPTAVTGPSSVSTLSLGDLHSVAVTSTGEVWAWGESADYRLGNNTNTPDKPSPQSVFTGLTLWAAAAPTINVPSATLGGSTTVTLTSSTSGAVIRYTQNGSLPTESDAEVPANGQIEISYSALLRARAFVTGRQPGIAPARADYELQSAPPVISPGTGTYTASQTVSITATGLPGAIRYTLDGSEPTAASSLYSVPIGVSTGTTIKAKTFPTNGWAASSAATAALTFNFGMLAPPSATPGDGVFATEPQVALLSIAGASIRYTLNGSTPTASSTLYTSAITIPSAGATLKSIAFHTDWTASTVRSDVYTVDSVAPTITSIRFPAAINGWHNGPTTVSFSCNDNVGIYSCPASTVVNTQGSHQVSGTAVDQVGRQTALQVQVDIDLTPPTITVTNSPPMTTSDSAVVITGDVSDLLSGIAAVTCNGQASTITSGVATCSVPLGRGRNGVAIVARDVAGNVTSKGFQIQRIGTATRMTFSPDSRAMLVGEKLPLSLADDFGESVLTATWTSSDSDVIQLTNTDPPYLVAVSPGTATISATKAGLTASANITAFAGATLPQGTTRWSIPPTPIAGIGTDGPLYTNRITEDSPAFYAVEWASSQYYSAFLRAMSSTGEQKWITEMEGRPLMGDTTGGVLLGIGWSHRGGIARITPSPNALPWRYESVGMTDQVTQAEGGTIYAIETIITDGVNRDGSEVIDTQLLMLNGDTGGVIKRIPIPRLTLTWHSANGCSSDARSEYEPEIFGPVTHLDGSATLLITSYSNARVGSCTVFDNVPREIDRGVKLWRVTPNGDLSVTDVFAQHCSLVNGGGSACDLIPTLKQVTPDTAGGSYAIWSHTPLTGAVETRLTRVSVEGAVSSERVVPASTGISVVGDEGTVYDETSAIDEATWTPKWPFIGRPLMPLHNGGVITHDGAVLRWYNGQGDLEQSVPLVANSTSSHAKQGEWLSVDQDFAFEGKPILAIAGPIPIQTRLASGQIISSRTTVFPTCIPPPFQADDPVVSDRSKGVPPNRDYRFKFDRAEQGSLWPLSDQDERIINVLLAFEMWEAANLEPGPPQPNNISFTKVEAEEEIPLRQKDDLGFSNGYAVSGITRGTREIQTGFLSNVSITWDDAVSQPVFYKKIALHELGHVLGVGHFQNATFPVSVMNPAGEFEDFRGFVSEVVTVCDRDIAREAALRTWVPPQ